MLLFGNDIDGEIAKKDLMDLGVNINFIKKCNTYTRNFHITIDENKIISKKVCPICGEKKWYEKSKVNDDFPTELIEKGSLYIFDTINKNNLKIIEKLKNKKIKLAIDIGQIGNLKYLRKDEIVDRFLNKFNFVQLNECVAKFLIEKFQYDDYKRINEIFNSDLVIITFGNDGATFIIGEKEYMFQIGKPAKELDATGAGDLFFSVILENLINSNYDINESIINKAYNEALEKVSILVGKVGARALIQDFHNKELINGCYCGMSNCEGKKALNKRKKISTNLDNLERRVLRALESNAYEKIKNVINKINDDCIIIGAGGSYAACYYASRVINYTKGINAIAMYPRDLLYRNNCNLKNLIAVSYSGTSPDIFSAFECANSRKYIITKGKEEKIRNKIDSNIEIISYCDAKYKAGRERGFLSIEGTIAPASLFAKYYYNSLKNSDSFEDFLKLRINYWKNYFKEYFKSGKNKLEYIFDKKNIIDLIHGDYTTSAALDMESKIVESGIYRVTMHEKKNFSHGRFISMEYFRPDVLIYLKQNSTTNYEDKLLKYIESQNIDYIIIESAYDGLLAEFDLLIASQFFMKQISELINIDLSKPSYTDEAMEIYKYIGKL